VVCDRSGGEAVKSKSKFQKEAIAQHLRKCLGILPAIKKREHAEAASSFEGTIEAASDFIFKALRFEECRDFKRHPMAAELFALCVDHAIETNNFDFFIRLGRVLEQPALKCDASKELRKDRLSEFLLAGWDNDIGKPGYPVKLKDLSDEMILEVAGRFLKNDELTFDAVRKARQRLHLERDSHPHIKKGKIKLS